MDATTEADTAPPTAGGAAGESTVAGMVIQEHVVAVERKSKLKVMVAVAVAVDESEGSFYVLRWTLDHLVRRSSPAPAADKEEEVEMITLVHVQRPFQHYAFPAGPAFYATSAAAESVSKAQEENLALILSRALHMCRESMATEQMHMDLLVVGSHGLGKIKMAFSGSVSDYCAHHAKCPILTVKPPKEVSKQ
ncbi:hypothetical protein BT93_L0081 [Corymbia citriodora subsp. variegata]|uniref:UspA domain-containing protein n=1 Tax=Corymbia citriodora subsp. variegata TaxID=360336 RepID=A0A8T0CRY7_CORYI|nr:hypothetical protein BT93_L0081 [Corymbia citriodora subsp. variegata]